jgi:hypothetical protein
MKAETCKDEDRENKILSLYHLQIECLDGHCCKYV